MEEYLRLLQAGERPDKDTFLARYVDVGEALAVCLQGLDFVQAAGGELSQSAAGPVPLEGLTSGDGIEPAVSLGDFRIVREVGRGGMGIVYEAEQISLRRRVALKVLPFAATMDPRHLQRFHNEAQAAACLHHTNIVPVFSVGSEHGVHFYAMQFIDGQPLCKIIHQLRWQEKKPNTREERTIAYQPSPGDAASTLPIAAITPLTGEGRRSRDYFRKVAELGIQAAEALDHAHQLGIVHRDIKPGNLMLDVRGNLWVADFGLAHMQHSDASLTLTGQTVGTPRYMSPEQALAKRVPIDHRTDVYSLGATLYELLTLRPAFTCEDRHELLRQIAFEEPAKPRQLERSIPAELEIIILKAMEKRPQDRYATAHDMAEDLRRWLKHEPIRARRPSWFLVGRKWARRHRALVGSTIVILALACLFLVGSISWIAGESSARRKVIERVVQEALDESISWQNSHDWSNARAAARRAVILSVGGVVNADLRRRVCERDNDLTLLDELVRLRDAGGSPDGLLLHDLTLPQAALRSPGDWINVAGYGGYHTVFTQWGLDLDKVKLEEAVARIQGSTVSKEIIIIRALDLWAVTCLHAQGAQDPKGLLLLRIARALDSDEERNRFRATLLDGGNKLLLDLRNPEVAKRLVPENQYYVLPYLLNVLPYLENRTNMNISALLEYQRQHPDDVVVNAILGTLFANEDPPRCDEAIRFFTAALALCPKQNYFHQDNFHIQIGKMLEMKGDVKGAIAEYYEVLRLSKNLFGAEELGDLLIRLGNIDEAIAVYRKAIEAHVPRQPSLHCLLGHALRRKGLYEEALTQYRRGYVLSLKGNWSDLGWADQCARWIRQGERLREYDTKLSLVLEGKARPANAEECLELARTSLLYLKCNVAAARLFRQAFSEQPLLADNLEEQNRYDAARAAALAGCGQGKDADKLDAKERARLRQQALDWLRADLKACRQAMGKTAGKASPMIYQRIQRMASWSGWNGNKAFAGVREDKALAKLSETERKKWQELWKEVHQELAVLDFEAELSRALESKAQLVGRGDSLVHLARQCFLYEKFNVAARLFKEAFSEQPFLADNLDNPVRYDAARAAALAGCGRGKDADKLDDKERARLRQQALDWLRADLKVYRQVMEQSKGTASPMIAQRMRQWRANTDFAGVHGAEWLAKLPEAERQKWQKHWQEVEELRQLGAEWLAKLPEAERQKWQKHWQEAEASWNRTTQQPETASSARP
jgi:serine/threonine protein kinase